MGTPEQNFRTAIDGGSDDEERERAIGLLETANECDSLAETVGTDDLEGRYREQALNALAHPQCKVTLADLMDDESLEALLRERADSLFDETPDDAGAGP